VATVAQTMGVRDAGGLAPLESLKSYLRDRELLLVLDNFEQLLGAAPELTELLCACPRLYVLVTSRASLRVSGERELAVAPLELPRPTLPSIACESVELFVERARAVNAAFALTDETAPAVAQICLRLDGLPFAIELAAARSRLLHPQAMLARLEHRLPFLTAGARDLPARQQTLRNTIAWSYDLLEPHEQHCSAPSPSSAAAARWKRLRPYPPTRSTCSKWLTRLSPRACCGPRARARTRCA
jgi:predicted ATPase